MKETEEYNRIAEALKEDGIKIQWFSVDAIKKLSKKEFKEQFKNHRFFKKDLDKYYNIFSGKSSNSSITTSEETS